MLFNKVLSIVYKDKDFRFFWCGYTVLLFGNLITTIALNLYIWNLYKSPVWTSLNLAITMVPTVILGPFFGEFIDRIDNRKLAVFLNIVNLFILIIPVYSVHIVPICIFSFLNGVIASIRFPWLQSYIQNLSTKESLVKANSSVSFSKTSTQLLAPLLVGGLISINIKLAFLLNILLLIISTISFCIIADNKTTINKLKNGKHTSTISNMKKSLFIMFSNKSILYVCVFTIFLLIFDGMLISTTVIYVKEILKASDFRYSLVTSIEGLGTLLSSITIGIIIHKYKKSLWYLLTLFGVIKIITTILFVYSSNYTIFLIIMFVQSYFWIGATIAENIMLQTYIPGELIGKVYAFYGSFSWLASFLGTVITGFLVYKFGVKVTITYFGLFISLLMLIFMMCVKYKRKKEIV